MSEPIVHASESPRPPAVPPAPPVFVPPPPRERSFRRGFGLGAGTGIGFGAAIGAAMLVSSMVLALAAGAATTAAAGVNTSKSQPLETIWGAETAPNKLRAIRIEGPILAEESDGLMLGAVTYGYQVADMIDALKKEDASGLLLIMNTPGGTINGSRAIADAIERYQSRTGNKVIAHVQGMSASGGMYAMAGVDRITADHGSLIGSIGVIFGPFTQFKDVVAISGSFTEAGVSTRGGITQEYLTQGKGKDFGNPFREMTQAERTIMMNGLENEYGSFVNWVAEARNIPADTIRNDLGAYIYDTKTAKQKRLIDEELGIEEAYRDAATFAGLDANQTRIVTAKAPGFLETLLGARSGIYGQGLAVKPIGNQPAQATAAICRTQSVLLWHGSMASACG